MIAISGFLTGIECIEVVFGQGFAPNPAGGAYSTGLTGVGRKREGEKSRPKPCFTITAVTETKIIASFGAVTETETEFR